VKRISAVILLFLSAVVTSAQEVPQQDKNYTVNVDVQLVQLPVSVLDKSGHPVSGLQKDHFQVFEDGVIQEISFFKHEDVPVSIGLIIDNSGSMRNKRERVNSAALTFAKEGNPQDETFIVNFDDAVYLEQDFTSNIADLVKSLSYLDTRGETALYDAVYLSAEHLNDGTRDKKALLLISDGEDNASKYSLDKVLAKLRESKVTVYGIGLLEEADQRGGVFRKSPSIKAREALEKLTQTTGGRAYFPKSVDEVGELCRQIAHDLRNHYTLGYTPSNKKLDGSWRKITVRVNPPKTVTAVTIRAKEGYYAPKAQDINERQP
jgi:VWFA-related protein